MALILAATTPGEPEIFASLQGEGASSGRACAFLRLSNCNLACTWCDTPYTWHFTGDNRPHRDGETFRRQDNRVTLDEADVAARIAALGRNRLVVTGGEPLLQFPALARMLEMLPDIEVEVETNGTIAPPEVLDALVAQYNVSPKLAHSGNPANIALPSESLDLWAAHPRAWFKFVVASREDVDDVREIQRKHAIAATRIFLMPEGRDSASLRARMRWLGPLCVQHGFNFTDRLHIHLFSDTRGT